MAQSPRNTCTKRISSDYHGTYHRHVGFQDDTLATLAYSNLARFSSYSKAGRQIVLVTDLQVGSPKRESQVGRSQPISRKSLLSQPLIDRKSRRGVRKHTRKTVLRLIGTNDIHEFDEHHLRGGARHTFRGQGHTPVPVDNLGSSENTSRCNPHALVRCA
ncbi:hypothetical protein EI94DRAFT_1249787 [Lactarius quietus]|nr:hypothetical protein EI94DRAFT_1249787 [Lactarius quietus]